jgi:uncharacterized protein (TIGR02118 family)
MIRISVLYPNTASARFDHDYYEQRHIPLVVQLLGPALRSVTVTRGVSPGPPWPAATYVCACHMDCDSLEAYAAALAAHAARLQDDLQNYTDIAPVIQVSEVTLPPAS